ncbi:MAG: hypothetical protein OXC05_15690 [Halieaceae bacterium]|nr:hypothetical protein [Halieaceae bacterium]
MASLLCAASLTYIIDPYDLYPPLPGLSPGKTTDLFYHLRLHKPYAMQRTPAEHLIVGSSRSARLPPQRPDATGYNASLPGVSLSEIRRMVEHAHVIKPLQSILVGLDYYMFREGHKENERYYKDHRLLRQNSGPFDPLVYGYRRIEDYWLSLLSVDALLDSVDALHGAASSNRKFNVDGTWEAKFPPRVTPAGLYSMVTRQKYREFSTRTGRLDFTELSRLTAFCAENDIPLTLLISPMHGMAMNAVNAAGKWNDYLSWQREAVELGGNWPETVSIFGLETNPRIIHEPIEAADPFFQDGVHYTNNAGARIMQCLHGECGESFRLDKLDSASIDGYLLLVDRMMRAYPAANPRDYARLIKWLEQ